MVAGVAHAVARACTSDDSKMYTETRLILANVTGYKYIECDNDREYNITG